MSTVEAYTTTTTSTSGQRRYYYTPCYDRCRYQLQEQYQRHGGRRHHHHHRRRRRRLYHHQQHPSDNDCDNCSTPNDWMSCIKHVIQLLFGGFRNNRNHFLVVEDVDNIYLHGTLLCASAVSYYDDTVLPDSDAHVESNEDKDDDEMNVIREYYKRIHYIPGHPITISGGVRRINSIQVGTAVVLPTTTTTTTTQHTTKHNPNNLAIIVSCRGTTPTIYDWLKDSDSKLVPFIVPRYDGTNRNTNNRNVVVTSEEDVPMDEVGTVSYDDMDDDDDVDDGIEFSYETSIRSSAGGRTVVGLVHTGFQSDLDSIYYKVIQEIQRQHVEATEIMNNTTTDATTTNNNNNIRRQPKLYITGHSKGGAIANLLAARIAAGTAVANNKNDDKKPFILPKPNLVCTFASSRYCNRQFQEDFYNTILNISSVSYEGYLDIVPFLPPTDVFIDLLKEHSRKRPQRQQQQEEVEGESKPPNISKILLEILNLERWYERGNMVPSTTTTTMTTVDGKTKGLGPQRRCYIDDKYQIYTLIDNDDDLAIGSDDSSTLATTKIGKTKSESEVDMERMLGIATTLKQGLTIAKNRFVAAHSLQPYTEELKSMIVTGEEGNGDTNSYTGSSNDSARTTASDNNSTLVTSYGTYASILHHD